MDNFSDTEQRIAEIEAELTNLDHLRNQLMDEITSLRQRLVVRNNPKQIPIHFQSSVTNHSSQEDKILLFRSLFKGREDIFPRRFENSKTGKSGYSPVCRNEWVAGTCQKPKISCLSCDARAFVPLSDEIVRYHLTGHDPHDRPGKDFTIGIYPLLPDETCWFLAVDFDKSTWQDDVKAFLDTCHSYQVPAALERSRSGNGGHVWIFFETPLSARLARQLGAFLLTTTMERRPEIGLDSYDRFFPNQDTMPKGGMGNLIALPLQKKPRAQLNSVFIDNDFNPFPDQWAFIASIQKLTQSDLEDILKEYQFESEITGVRAVILDENESEPWKLSPSRKIKEPPIIGPLPDHLTMIYSNQIYIQKEGLPPALRNRIIRLAAFQNPEFYKAQAMRLSTFGKPRIISCCEEFPKHLALPRGCLDELEQLLNELGIQTDIDDQRVCGKPVSFPFIGILRPEQKLAAGQLMQCDIGVLSASTAFGKTVIGTWLIHQRKVNTLIIVHRRQLMEQWIDSLQAFLGIMKKEIGQYGSGKQKTTGVIDVAMIQSLIHKGSVNDLIDDYGQIIIDECHHISAVSFEQVIRQAKAKYITGLSATVTRQDGHHPIIFMQCGPIRYRVNDRQQAVKRSFRHQVITRSTLFSLPDHSDEGMQTGIQEIYTLLAKDPQRNQMIINDVLTSLASGRSPVLLTERRDHLDYFTEAFSSKVKNLIVLSGGMSRKQLTSTMEQLAQTPEDEERLIIATGRYLGEGFDDPRLDTLFLTLPIAWRGTVAQYAGRLHRNYENKNEVIIYDYVDDLVPVLASMFGKRKKGYTAIGYEISHEG